VALDVLPPGEVIVCPADRLGQACLKLGNWNEMDMVTHQGIAGEIRIRKTRVLRPQLQVHFPVMVAEKNDFPMVPALGDMVCPARHYNAGNPRHQRRSFTTMHSIYQKDAGHW
jgi:hypothetical protein